MNIRKKINRLIGLQDAITRMMGNSPPGGSDDHRKELIQHISNRTLLANEIVEYVIQLEERAKLVWMEADYD